MNTNESVEQSIRQQKYLNTILRYTDNDPDIHIPDLFIALKRCELIDDACIQRLFTYLQSLESNYIDWGLPAKHIIWPLLARNLINKKDQEIQHIYAYAKEHYSKFENPWRNMLPGNPLSEIMDIIDAY